jgi:hypothetical protein
MMIRIVDGRVRHGGYVDWCVERNAQAHGMGKQAVIWQKMIIRIADNRV